MAHTEKQAKHATQVAYMESLAKAKDNLEAEGAKRAIYYRRNDSFNN